MHLKSIRPEIDKLSAKNPDILKEVIESMYEAYPEMTKKVLRFASLGHHLDEEMMCCALSTITRYDGEKAPFWSMDEFRLICKNNGIYTADKNYNEFDLNFWAQVYCSDFKSLGKEPIKFINMAVDILNDYDDPKACESAYWEAKHRICHWNKR